ncbi:hypothetical protein B0H17DRAFT_1133076 [Mycena rosella]|uniref:Uncharacterized protein n=1 Tax=Mycena rosella TaxID=1033263 RepID=A0AAD7DIM1_MYCRO|nr:hypothetical protein B0H17DRAFT_1133076 [Mycena rosella]
MFAISKPPPRADDSLRGFVIYLCDIPQICQLYPNFGWADVNLQWTSDNVLACTMATATCVCSRPRDTAVGVKKERRHGSPARDVCACGDGERKLEGLWRRTRARCCLLSHRMQNCLYATDNGRG